jgi:cytochrome oxidase Cu insertion factor (SCO1/SenC/PrrC family)
MSKTPEQKWKESIVSYRKNCQKILDLSKSIRYAGVINEFGRTLTGIIQPGLRPLLNPESAKNEFFIISNLITLRNSQAKAFGNLDSAIIRHKNAIIVCIPQGKVVYYVSVNPNAKSIDEITRKVKSIV